MRSYQGRCLLCAWRSRLKQGPVYAGMRAITHAKKRHPNIEGVVAVIYKFTSHRRWRFWACFQGKTNGPEYARREIAELEEKGFKAKIWAPLPHHKTTGHFHVVVLASMPEFCELMDIETES